MHYGQARGGAREPNNLAHCAGVGMCAAEASLAPPACHAFLPNHSLLAVSWV